MNTVAEINDMPLSDLVDQGIEGFFAHQTLANIKEHLNDKSLTDTELVNAIRCEFNDLGDWVKATLLKQAQEHEGEQFLSDEYLESCCHDRREANAINAEKALNNYMRWTVRS